MVDIQACWEANTKGIWTAILTRGTDSGTPLSILIHESHFFLKNFLFLCNIFVCIYVIIYDSNGYLALTTMRAKADLLDIGLVSQKYIYGDIFSPVESKRI